MQARVPHLAAAEDEAGVGPQEPNALGVGLPARDGSRDEADAGPDVVQEQHVLCENAGVRSLPEEPGHVQNEDYLPDAHDLGSVHVVK